MVLYFTVFQTKILIVFGQKENLLGNYKTEENNNNNKKKQFSFLIKNYMGIFGCECQMVIMITNYIALERV